MSGISKELSSFNLALILPTFFLVFGASSSMINVGKFDRVPTGSGNIMTSVRQSRSVFQCAMTCIAAHGSCRVQPYCSAFCQSVTSSICYLNMTSESLAQPLPDTSDGYTCFVRGKPACPDDLGYLLVRGQCVKMYQELRNSAAARSQCEEDGGHLYYYKNLTTDEPVISELRDVMREARSDWLLVGADKMTTSDFQWHDGCPLPDSDPVWYHNQPNDSGERCVIIQTANMRLHDFTCGEMHYFVCQIDV